MEMIHNVSIMIGMVWNMVWNMVMVADYIYDLLMFDLWLDIYSNLSLYWFSDLWLIFLIGYDCLSNWSNEVGIIVDSLSLRRD